MRGMYTKVEMNKVLTGKETTNKMILTIPKNERDIFEKACATHNVDCTFFTVESNDELLTFQTENISEKMIYQLGRTVQMYWQEKMEKTYKDSHENHWKYKV